MNISTALPTFVITLREGFEAALIVGIVFACLQKAQKQEYYRWIYSGVTAGIIASVSVGLLLWQSLQGIETSEYYYAPFIKQILKTLFALVAVSMLSWMLLWMSKQAKSLKGEVEGAVNIALTNNNASKGVFLLVFIAVLREGFETVLFITAQFQSDFISPTIGAIAGLLLAVLMGWALFYWGVKINIRLFFQIMGVFLLLIVAGLVISALKNLDGGIMILSQINPNYQNICLFDQDSCLLGMKVWNASNFLPDNEFPGILLKTLFGYRDQIYLLQLVCYFLFLGIVGNLYFSSLNPKNE
ncbi:FTR1 family protein [Geminocystis sp. NIES-3709]|uniref:FTR1 family iron permease n=1 Tax=Geminocystis sp. NIES-3709 TaxID=1617448 RepID=UPI000825DAC2|nr:FTR1 family protein [Geminocystis sp. NIES-3709]